MKRKPQHSVNQMSKAKRDILVSLVGADNCALAEHDDYSSLTVPSANTLTAAIGRACTDKEFFKSFANHEEGFEAQTDFAEYCRNLEIHRESGKIFIIEVDPGHYGKNKVKEANNDECRKTLDILSAAASMEGIECDVASVRPLSYISSLIAANMEGIECGVAGGMARIFASQEDLEIVIGRCLMSFEDIKQKHCIKMTQAKFVRRLNQATMRMKNGKFSFIL